MLSVEAAQKLVLERVGPLPAETMTLSDAALGVVLAEDVVSDLDMPPYDKSMMDGYAVRSADLPEGRGVLQVIEEVAAGRVPTKTLAQGQATRIMTGAPMPPGADAVVVVERTRMLESQRVEIDDRQPKPGQNILAKAREMRRGEKVLLAGTLLRPQELGVLATVGRTSALVYPAARVAVLSTGDEVVEAQQTPGPGQIRNSNGPMLMAQARRAGALPRYLGIARDRLDSLEPLIRDGLGSDILILSGGVSAGKLDLVPDVMANHKVEAIFHKVAMKPGKPVFFGVKKQDAGKTTLVFGLPGNPVSALVCFELFVRPALRAQMHLPPGPVLVDAVLAEDFAHRSDRPTYHPARLELAGPTWQVKPVPWFGSPDLRGVTPANAFVVFPAGDHRHQKGQVFSVLKTEN